MEKKYLDSTGLTQYSTLLKTYLNNNKVTSDTVEGWGFIKSETSGLVFEYNADTNALNITGSNTQAEYDSETKTFNITTL